MSDEAALSEAGQIVAGLVHAVAKNRTDGVYKGPINSLREDAISGFNVRQFEEQFPLALEFWEKQGNLRRHQYPGVEDYISMETGKIDIPLKVAGQLMRDNSEFDLSDEIIHNYLEVGRTWLHSVAMAYKKRVAEELDGNKTIITPHRIDLRTIDSSVWTGLSSDFVLTEQKRIKLTEKLREAETSLDNLKIPNSDKSMARAYLTAALILSETPEPPADLIWEMVNRANQISGIAALLVSIIGLFA